MDRNQSRGEAGVLASCYRRSLEVADAVGARSVAFPAISTGIYGFPRHLAAGIAVATLRDTPAHVGRTVLVAFDAATMELYERLLEAAG